MKGAIERRSPRARTKRGRSPGILKRRPSGFSEMRVIAICGPSPLPGLAKVAGTLPSTARRSYQLPELPPPPELLPPPEKSLPPDENPDELPPLLKVKPPTLAVPLLLRSCAAFLYQSLRASSSL